MNTPTTPEGAAETWDGWWAGATKGAALVAAMRMLRASQPPGELPNGRCEPR